MSTGGRCPACGQPLSGPQCTWCGHTSWNVHPDTGRSTAWVWAAVSLALAAFGAALVLVLVVDDRREDDSADGGARTVVSTPVTTTTPTTTAPPPSTVAPPPTMPPPPTTRPVRVTAPPPSGFPIASGWYAVLHSDVKGAIPISDLEDTARRYDHSMVVDTDDYLNGQGRAPDFHPAPNVYATVVGPFSGPTDVEMWCQQHRSGAGCNVRRFVPR